MNTKNTKEKSTNKKKSDNILKPKYPDDGLNGLRQAVIDINNGDFKKKCLTEKEFIEEMKKW
jgi:hypothetical protein